nr:stage III sporulation protein AB [uncultured Mediterraneibacter sp.]
MQRVIGGILILVATGGAGYVYCRDLRNYLAKMCYLRYVMSLIRGEISYTQAPLPEIFIGVAQRIKEPYRIWLIQTARAVEDRQESGFARMWNRCVDKYLSPLGLKSEHSILIKEPGTFLGSLESDTLDRTLVMYLNKFDLEIEKLREGLASKTRIGSCLGVMSGIFLIVLLL